MNRFFCLIFLILLFGCKKENESNKNFNDISQYEIEKNNFKPEYGKVFFDYDEIDYYHSKIDGEDIGELYDKQDSSNIDKLKFGVILDKTPQNINDLGFINELSKIGFTKSKIDQSKFAEIDKIFIEKTAYEILDKACIAIYRDILVFKKQKKVVGIAKICFGCDKNKIVGTKSNTENFGQDGDYEKLSKLILN